jgi:hypothetical protein
MDTLDATSSLLTLLTVLTADEETGALLCDFVDGSENP